MSVNLDEIIICPKCQSSLEKKDDKYICTKCGSKYKTIEGIPVLIDYDKIPKHLIQQIEYFSNESKDLGSDYQIEPWQQSYVKSFIEYTGIKEEHTGIKDKQSSLIIDCGTGTGYIAIELAKLGYTVLATDLTLDYLIRLNNNARVLGLSDKILTLCCNAQSLPVKNSIADYFVSNAVLEHLPDDVKAANEIDRVISQNGKIMVTVPHRLKYINPLLWLVNIIHDKRIGHLRRYDFEALSSLFKNFEPIKTIYKGHSTKVFLVLLNMIFKNIEKEKIENVDEKKNDKKYGANNIIMFFKKR